MEADEALSELIGHAIVDTYSGEDGIHITLDDGRVLILFGLGIFLPGENVFH